MNQKIDRQLAIDLLAAYRRLTYAEQMTLAAQYVENLHRIGAMDDAGNPYTLTEFLADTCETWHYDIKPADEFETMMILTVEHINADRETCHACPTHCTPCGDGDHRYIDTFDPTTWACETCGMTTPATVTE